MSCAALDLLIDAQRRTGSLLSIGLEPSPAYIPESMRQDPESFLHAIIEGASGVCCAFKFNLAFFESMGSAGWSMLERVRARIPDHHLVIADAKRGDIGSTAQHYARALYTTLGAHSATVNPLMGADSAAPFLEHDDRLTFVLGLTSNAGAADFLLHDGLGLRIAAHAERWNRTSANCGLVVGATRTETMRDVRAAAPSLPMLVPGLGAQGGDLEAVLAHLSAGPTAPLILHVTRSILPDEGVDPIQSVRAKVSTWNDRVRNARDSVGVES